MKRLVILITVVVLALFAIPTAYGYNDNPGGSGCSDPNGCLQYWYFWGGICMVNVFPDGHADLWGCSPT